MNLTIEIMNELAGHVGYEYQELPPEMNDGTMTMTVLCLARPKDGVEFYTVRDYITRDSDSATWKEGIEKCMHLGAAYTIGSADETGHYELALGATRQEARLGMLRAIIAYGSKILKQERP